MKKNVVVNSVIYTFSGFLLKGFSFFLLPLYTRYLSTDDYGLISVAQSFLTSMAFVVAFSLFSSVNRFYVDLKYDEEKLKRFYGTVLSFALLSGFTWCVFLTLIRHTLEKYVFSGISYYPVILICLVTLIFNCQQNLYDTVLKSQQKAAKSSILSICVFFVNLTFTLLFVLKLHWGAAGVLLATMITSVIYTAYFWCDLLRTKSIIVCIDIQLLRSALRYSLPIIPHNLSTQIAILISKILIGNTTSIATLGIYTVATKFGDMADVVQNYVNNAYGPWLFEQLHEKRDGFTTNIRNTANLLCMAIGFFFVGISLFSQEYIFLFIESSYKEAWRYIPLIVGVFAIKTMYYFYVNILFFYKKASRYLFIATVTSSVLNTVLSVLFIPSWGAYGSIAADAIAMVVRVTIVVVISKFYDDVGLKVNDFILNFLFIELIIFAGLAPSYLFSLNRFSLQNLIYKLIVLVLYCVVMVLRFRKPIIEFLRGKGWLKATK